MKVLTTKDENYINKVLSIVGENVRKARGRMSQIELARKAGVSRNTIWAIEKGRSIELDNLLKIARALNLRPEDLFLTDKDRLDITMKTKLLLDRISSALQVKE